MTTEQKVELVAAVRDEHGLTLALTAIGLPKSTWYYHQNEKVTYEEKYAHLRPLVENIIRANPAYGIPRITKELHETYEEHVNHKVIQRLLNVWELSLVRSARPPAPSHVQQAIVAGGEQVNMVAQLEQIGLFEVAYTDFTELVYANGTRKAHLMPIIGHVSKMAYGWAVGRRANTALALQVWQRAKATFETLIIPYQGMIVHHDQDSVYTGYAWTNQLLLEDQVQLSYTLNGARDNPVMEAFIGRFKTENRSLLLDAESICELRGVVSTQMHYYNTERRHSSIAYLAPLTYIKRVRREQAVC